MITVAEADQLLRQVGGRTDAEQLPLTEACGRVLREDVSADRDYPPFDRVAMDGIALSCAAWEEGRKEFRVQAMQRAGEPARRLNDPDTCIEIMTGAPLPHGCNAVVRYEDLRLHNGSAAISHGVKISPWRNVHRRGVDSRAGEPVLASGTRLRPPHVAALASIGRSRVAVGRAPPVTVLSTGDELVGIEDAVEPHQIRQSNGHAIRAALVQHGVMDTRVVHAEDSRSALLGHIEEALHNSEVIVLSGGVSAGRYDLVPKTLDELGVEEVFHKVRQKPGKPLWFGMAPGDRAVFGLPGNPVSALICCYRYVLPFIDRMMGVDRAPVPWTSVTRLPRRAGGRTHFVPVRLERERAEPVPTNGSGDFLSILASDGFVEISPELGEPGPVPLTLWSTF